MSLETDAPLAEDELDDDAVITYTRGSPDGWSGHTGRIGAAILAPLVEAMTTVFICGSN